MATPMMPVVLDGQLVVFDGQLVRSRRPKPMIAQRLPDLTAAALVSLWMSMNVAPELLLSEPESVARRTLN